MSLSETTPPIILWRDEYFKFINSRFQFEIFLYTRQNTGRIMEWPCPSVPPSVGPSVRPSVGPSFRPFTIACERNILKNAGQIDFTFWYGLNTTKTLAAIDLGHATKTKMAATAVLRLTLYPIQNIACERDILKTAFRINFTFWCDLNTTKTSYAIYLGHSTKTMMAATAVCRLTLYPMQDIACELSRLKTACRN